MGRAGSVAPPRRHATFIPQPTQARLARYERAAWPVIDARYLGNYNIWLESSDGKRCVVDLADGLYGEPFAAQCATARFAEFYVDYGLATIARHRDVDFAPDCLYERPSATH